MGLIQVFTPEQTIVNKYNHDHARNPSTCILDTFGTQPSVQINREGFVTKNTHWDTDIVL